MFNRLPGAMLSSGHKHQCKKGRNCSRVLSQHTAAVDTPHSHSLFNPAKPEAELSSVNPAESSILSRSLTGVEFCENHH